MEKNRNQTKTIKKIMSMKYKIKFRSVVVMEYRLGEERVGAPTYKVDEANDELINMLAEFLKMEIAKVKFFTEKMELAWLDEPSIVGVTDEQLIRINDLKKLLRGLSR